MRLALESLARGRLGVPAAEGVDATAAGPTVPHPHQALGPLQDALISAAGARSDDSGASSSQEDGPEAGAPQGW
jgi:hypothetical protein